MSKDQDDDAVDLTELANQLVASVTEMQSVLFKLLKNRPHRDDVTVDTVKHLDEVNESYDLLKDARNSLSSAAQILLNI